MPNRLSVVRASAFVAASYLMWAAALAQPTAGPEIPVPSDPVAKAAFDMLNRHCARCHQQGRLTKRERPSKGFGNVLMLDQLAKTPQLVRPGDPDGSKLFKVVVDKEDPYDLYYEFDPSVPEVTDADVEALRAWIESLDPTVAAAVKAQRSAAAVPLPATLSSIDPDPQRRVALVIGDAAYQTLPPLKNPGNDARRVADALQAAGASVQVVLNANRAEMLQAIREFAQNLDGAGTGIIYYAGHGGRFEGIDCMLPVDAKVPTRTNVDFECVPLELAVRQSVRLARRTLVFWDTHLKAEFYTARQPAGAEREAPFASMLPNNVLFAYAAGPEQLASDGEGDNSPFASALADGIRASGMEIHEMLLGVGSKVANGTGGQQTPWFRSALLERFYFIAPKR